LPAANKSALTAVAAKSKIPAPPFLQDLNGFKLVSLKCFACYKIITATHRQTMAIPNNEESGAEAGYFT
jgi:hypothetical protein